MEGLTDQEEKEYYHLAAIQSVRVKSISTFKVPIFMKQIHEAVTSNWAMYQNLSLIVNTTELPSTLSRIILMQTIELSPINILRDMLILKHMNCESVTHGLEDTRRFAKFILLITGFDTKDEYHDIGFSRVFPFCESGNQMITRSISDSTNITYKTLKTTIVYDTQELRKKAQEVIDDINSKISTRMKVLEEKNNQG